MLQLEHGLRVEQVDLALTAPLVLAAELELAVGPLLRTGRVCGGVAGGDLGGDLVEADPAEPADRAGEVLLDELVAESDGFEDLRAGVAGDGRHAHLRHHLEHALAARLDVVAHGLVRVDRAEAVETAFLVGGDQVLDRLERQVRVDRPSAVADEQRHVVDLAGVAALDEQTDHRPLLRADQVVVHRGGQQQRRDRRLGGVGVAIGQHDDACPAVDRRRNLAADRRQRALEGEAAAGDAEEALDDVGAQAGEAAVVVGVDDAGELVVVDDRERQDELATALRSRLEQVGLGTDRRGHGRDDLFADGIERRVGDLGEELGEVVEQQARPVRQHGDRCVRAHRAERLVGAGSHRGEDDLELLVAVAEQLLAAQHAVVAEHDVLAVGQVVELDEAVGEPLGVGMLGGERRLDLLVVDDAALGGVDEEHATGLQPALGDDLRRVDVDDADLRRHHHHVVVGHPVAARTQAVAVEHGTDHRAVGERHAGRAVPRLHHGGVEAVERPLGGVHLVVVLPGLRDHHQDGVVQRAPTEVQQLEGLVEPGGVGGARRADRKGPLDAGDARRTEHGLAGAHPVLVALDGVDLAVVGDVAVRVGERPGRERVRGEAAVHEQQGALEALVVQIGEERRELRRRQHPLVDERARRERREVRRQFGVELVLGALAGDERLAVEVDAGGALGVGDDEVAETRHRRAGGGAEARRVDGDVTPPDDDQTLVAEDRLDRRLGLLGGDVVVGQEGHADGVGAGRREIDALRPERSPAGTGRGSGRGCRRRRRCRVRPPWRRDARGWSAPGARSAPGHGWQRP